MPASERTNVRSEFKITNTPWNSKLGDTTSQEFRTLADKLHQAVRLILKKIYIIYVKDFIRSFVFFSFLISFIFSIQLLSLLRTIPGFVDVKILRFRLELTTILFTKVFFKFRCINLSALCKILIIITDGAA